jgi:hypothetical protein
MNISDDTQDIERVVGWPHGRATVLAERAAHWSRLSSASRKL